MTNPPRPAGIDLAAALRRRLGREPLPRLPAEGDLAAWDWRSADAFLTAVWTEARAQVAAGAARGCVLFNQPHATYIGYVPSTELATPWPAAPPALIDLLRHTVAIYDSAGEAVLVLQTRTQVQALLLETGGGGRVLGTFALRPLPPKPAPVRLPAGVHVTRWEGANGAVSYYFSHDKLGRLGRIRLVPRDAHRMALYTEVARVDPATDPVREEIFGALADEITPRLLAAWPADLPFLGSNLAT